MKTPDPKKRKPKPAPRKSDPYAEGADAAIAGESDTANPYVLAPDAFLSWNDGYNSIAEPEKE